MKGLNLFISSASNSEDDYAGQAIKELKEQKAPDMNLALWGIGGSAVKEQGAEILQDSSIFDFYSPLSIIKNFFTLVSLENKISTLLKERKPDMALLVGNSIVNLRIASLIKKNIPFCKIVYYIAPQVWAWNEERIKEIPNLVDRLLTILPFEEPLHREFGTSSKFVGHPAIWEILDQEEETFNREDFLSSLQINPNNKVIALCPGSRLREVETLLPVFIESAKELIKKQASVEFILVRAPGIEREKINKILKNSSSPRGLLKIVDSSDLKPVLKSAELLWAHSGAVTLQAAYCEVPTIVGFKENSFVWKIISKLRRITFMGLPNIVAGGAICPELIQDDCQPSRWVEESLRFLDSPALIEDVKQNLVNKVKDYFVFEASPATFVASEILMIHQINRTSLENQIHMREQAKKNSQMTSAELHNDSNLNRSSK